MIVVADSPVCAKCGWPEDYAIHRAENREETFPTADGIRPLLVKGHEYVALGGGAP